MKDDFLELTQGLTKTSFLESNCFDILDKEENNGKTVIEENDTCEMANIYIDLAKKIINE